MTKFLTENVSFLPTDDGSMTLYHHGVEASYRSTGGALTESSHVFLEGTGLLHRTGEWRVLELGFGGAINFLLTASACLREEGASSLRYGSVEREPLPASLFHMPAYTGWVETPELLSLVKEVTTLAQRSAHSWVTLSKNIRGKVIELSLFVGDWGDSSSLSKGVHAVYHDPFGPKVNADAWSADCFRWSASQMQKDARLATYSAAGAVRRAMSAAGLHWKKIPGPGKKREVTIAELSPLE